MKFKRFATLSAIALASSAAIALPTSMTVYSASNNYCRALFAEYDKAYGTETTFVIKPGATGLLAAQDMLASNKNKKFSVMCGGLSETVMNAKAYPASEDVSNQLKMVTILSVAGLNFSTGPNSKFNSLPELLASGRNITVGYAASSIRFAAERVFKGANVTWVSFKSSADALPSLADGSLDVQLDGGNLATLVAAGKLKTLGHINGPKTAPGTDWTSQYPEAAKVMIIFGVIADASTSAADVEELNARLSKLLVTPMMLDTIRSVNNKSFATPVTVDEANRILTHLRGEFGAASK